MSALEKPNEITVRIPYNFDPRWYQVEVMDAFAEGYKRLLLVWHRRCGKDLSCLASIVVPQMLERVGYYLYVYPTSTLGKRAMWRGLDNEGRSFLSRIPDPFVKKKYNSEMLVELTNGSLMQVVGSDRIDNVGINPVGIVLSEAALQVPTAWEYMRPILRFNGGWALFNSTPRGKNHFYDTYEMAVNNPKWFVSHLTIDDTQLLTDEDIDEERAEGMSEEMIQQEYYCSFDRGIEGAYFGRYVDIAEREGRISFVPHEESLPVHTIFDLGMDDSTAIWYVQLLGLEIRYIDYYENNGQSLEHYAREMKSKEYVYGDIFFPHDGKVRELGSGISRKDKFERLMGIPVQIVPDVSFLDGIECARRMFKRFWFDLDKTATKKHKGHVCGVDCLKYYQKKWDEKAERYEDKPKKSKWNHGADGVRYTSIVVDKGLLTNNNNSNLSKIQELNERYGRRRV